MTSSALASCPLPIANKQTARGLLRLYARLKGELAKHGAGSETMVSLDETVRVMGHIAALMPFLSVNFDPSALKPIKTFPKIGPLGYGDVRAGVLAQLKSRRDWMTYPEIADGIIAKERLELSTAQRKHFLQKLREGTHALLRAGAVEREKVLKLGENQSLQRWRLSSALFRRTE